MSGKQLATRFQTATAGALAALGLFAAMGTAALGAECENPDELTFAIIPTEEVPPRISSNSPFLSSKASSRDPLAV